MSDSLNSFCLVATKGDWEAYKDEVARALGEEVTIVTPTKLEFPSEPESYPCLVATVIARADPVKPGAVSSAKICGCFVYKEDAKTLLDSCIGTEVFADVSKLDAAPEEEEEDNRPDADNMVFLTFGLIRELESIGAIKRESLAQSMAFAETWLKYSNAENQDFTKLMQSFWKEVDSNAG